MKAARVRIEPVGHEELHFTRVEVNSEWIVWKYHLSLIQYTLLNAVQVDFSLTFKPQLSLSQDPPGDGGVLHFISLHAFVLNVTFGNENENVKC